MAESGAPPLSYGVLLYPGFEVLDVAGPMECLNVLARRLPNSGLTLSVIGRPVDADHAATPMEISPANPANGPPEKPVPTASFSFEAAQIYKPTHTFETAPPLDVLIVGGGFGSLPMSRIEQEIEFVKKVFPSLQYLFTICTGSGIAAEAGVLDGLRATSNKASWDRMTVLGPKTHWVAQARWVADGKVWTTSGVSAGTDGMIAFIREFYKEEQYPGVVQAILNAMEYNHEPDSSHDPFAEIFGAQDVSP